MMLLSRLAVSKFGKCVGGRDFSVLARGLEEPLESLGKHRSMAEALWPASSGGGNKASDALKFQKTIARFNLHAGVHALGKNIDLKAPDWLSRFEPISIDVEETVAHALELMLKFQVGSLMLTKRGQTGVKICGIVSEKDLLAKIYAKEKPDTTVSEHS